MRRPRLTLRLRSYVSMLAMILVSFLVTGGIALYDHFEQSEKYKMQRLERKEKAVKASMTYFLNQNGGYMASDSILYQFSEKICELSDVHNLFIVMYDLRGNYLISTNSDSMAVLNAPSKVNYTILKQLVTGNNRAVLEKSIDSKDLSYAYWYFNDIEEKPIAIVGVVYENSEFEGKDIIRFLEELGQSYIILFILAAVVAYLLSTYITKSLQEIVTKMKGIQLGGKNDEIEWNSEDEIGALVSQYNVMLLELEKSANLLAQEERESAWREMAKQVAHEIKNPLTPMKLRVQHLQRSWEDGSPDFDTRLKQFVKSMTEQIDTLSHIASEFSNFAKMPKPNLETLDLTKVLDDVVDIYRDQKNYQLSYRKYHLDSALVRGDKEQMIRVFNNLINNAMQAIPDGVEGKIDIAVRGYKNRVIVRVSDNGIGISEEGKKKIFVPNFTTKSTGTGLGLAMVKNIMQHTGGNVFFWSKAGRGAAFYLEFSRG